MMQKYSFVKPFLCFLFRDVRWRIKNIVVLEVHEFGKVYHWFFVHQMKKYGLGDGITRCVFIWLIVCTLVALIYWLMPPTSQNILEGMKAIGVNWNSTYLCFGLEITSTSHNKNKLRKNFQSVRNSFVPPANLNFILKLG